MSNHVYAVIMAGGVGSRFWPRSRKNMPKQLLSILGQQTMIQETIERLLPLVPIEQIYVVTHKVQGAMTEEQIPQLPPDNIILEPEGRNTAPCVGLSAMIIHEKDPDAVILTLPADHHITPPGEFIKDMQRAIDFATKHDALLTFGITPTRPETGYGYIHYKTRAEEDGIFKVNRFVEKPNLEKANEYLSSGEYDWNSGMFCWRSEMILSEIQTHFPELSQALDGLESRSDHPDFTKKLKQIYPAIPSISIDYAIMEKSQFVFKAETHFEWSDVGHWESVYEYKAKDVEGNALDGDIWVKDTQNSYVYAPEKFTALIGVENLIVVDTPDALLVCHRERAQDVKDVVAHLRAEGRDPLL